MCSYITRTLVSFLVCSSLSPNFISAFVYHSIWQPANVYIIVILLDWSFKCLSWLIRYGSHLVSLFGYEENDEVSQIARNSPTPSDTYWIGWKLINNHFIFAHDRTVLYLGDVQLCRFQPTSFGELRWREWHERAVEREAPTWCHEWRQCLSRILERWRAGRDVRCLRACKVWRDAGVWRQLGVCWLWRHGAVCVRNDGWSARCEARTIYHPSPILPPIHFTYHCF